MELNMWKRQRFTSLFLQTIQLFPVIKVQRKQA